MLFDEIAQVMSERPYRAMARKTGLSRAKVRRMAQDYNVLYALRRLGYHLELVEDSVSSKFQP